MRNNVNFAKVSFGKVGDFRLELVAFDTVTVNCEGHFRLYIEALSNCFRFMCYNGKEFDTTVE